MEVIFDAACRENKTLIISGDFNINLLDYDTNVNVSWIKNKIQKFVGFFDENINLPPPVVVQGEPVSFVNNFVYLGSAIGSGERSFMEINGPLEITFFVIKSLSRSVWRLQYFCRKTIIYFL